jgi:hypothetical protein
VFKLKIASILKDAYWLMQYLIPSPPPPGNKFVIDVSMVLSLPPSRKAPVSNPRKSFTHLVYMTSHIEPVV